MNIKDATSTLLVSAALTGLLAGSVRAEDTKTEETKATTTTEKKVPGKHTKKKCVTTKETKETSCKGKGSCKAKEETK